MRAPLESSVPDYLQGSGPGQAGAHRASEALRLWLVSGIHSLGVDKRRRAGSHSNVRELLVAEPTTDGGWSETASALRRHTLHAAIAQLSALERNVVSLAYLEGHTNREIATALGLSVTTVRRRLRIALGRLQAYLASSGAWLASILLLGLALFAHWTRADRVLQSARASGWLEPAATVATGVVAATVITYAMSGPQFSEDLHRAPSAAAGLPRAVASGTGSLWLATVDTVKPAAQIADTVPLPVADPTPAGHGQGKHRALGHLKQKS